MKTFTILLLLFLILCAATVSMCKNVMTAVIIFMSYSLAMSLVWIILESPDLAITEAAVGAGVTSLLFFVALKKIHALHPDDEKLQLKHGMTEDKENVSNH